LLLCHWPHDRNLRQFSIDCDEAARKIAMTSAIDIERSLRARYRQPAGVEQFGIEPVPEERKTTGWFDLFSIMFNFLINPGMMLSGSLMVAAGLSFQAALATGFFGRSEERRVGKECVDRWW